MEPGQSTVNPENIGEMTMQLKKEVVIKNTTATIMLSLVLMIFGLASPLLFNRWMPITPPDAYSYSALFVSGAVGIVLGIYSHEYYRYLMSKLLGLESVLQKDLGVRVIMKDHLVKWQAISITIAPFTDLTLIALLMMALIKSWLIIAGVITYLTINLMLSSKDIITCFWIVKYTASQEAVLFTREGFQIWTARE